MKKIIIVLIALLSISRHLVAQDSYGQDFWLAVPQNYGGGGTIELYVTAQTAASVTVTCAGISFTTTVPVAANTLATIALPYNVQIGSGGSSNLGVHITATADVTVYLMNQQTYTTDAHLALPVDALGLDYYLMTYVPGFAPSSITVVATQNNTTINVNPTVANSPGIPVGINTSVVLNQGDVYTVRSSVTSGQTGDLTGSHIFADKPIAVIGASECAQVPYGTPYCDYIVEQMTPTSAWGKNFVTVPLGGRTSGDVFRFLSNASGTQVSVDGSVVATIGVGQFYETVLASGTYHRIASNNPILVGQFAKGSTSDGTVSDPFFALVPPDDQFIVNYIISSGTPNVFNNYVNIISPNSNLTNVQVDGSTVSAGLWNAITGTSFSGAIVGPFTNGIHTVTSILPIGVMAYGWGDDDSYGYLGGQSFSPVATVSQMSLNLTATTAYQAQQQCFVATVLDQNNNPVPGVLVNFTVAGVTNTAGFGNTNAQGQVTLCYTTCLPGQDVFTATIAGLSSSVNVTVLPTTLGITPTAINATTGVQACAKATVLDGNNNPVQNAVVTFTVSGVNNVAAQNVLTNASGQALLCYTPAASGNDIVYVTSGCALGAPVNVNVTVSSSTGCQLNTSISTTGVRNPLWAAAGANDVNAYYNGLSMAKGFQASVSGGVPPYNYTWSTTSGIFLQYASNPKKGGLYYPTTSCWVKVTITDNGGNACKDSVWVPFVDYTCPPQPGMLWWYQLCNVQTSTTVCVKGTGVMTALVQTGNYVLGPCTPKADFENQAAAFSVYPNPTTGTVILELPVSKEGHGEIAVLDANGGILYRETTYIQEGVFYHTLDLSALPNGLYLVRVATINDLLIEKVQLIR